MNDERHPQGTNTYSEGPLTTAKVVLNTSRIQGYSKGEETTQGVQGFRHHILSIKLLYVM